LQKEKNFEKLGKKKWNARVGRKATPYEQEGCPQRLIKKKGKNWGKLASEEI